MLEKEFYELTLNFPSIHFYCIGNIILLFEIHVPVGTIGLIFIGLFSGGFVGCLAVALEEVIQVFPIFMHRIKLKIGMPILVLCLAIGKGIGAFYQLFWNR
jgi:stage V sporulation protein AB